MSHAAPARLRHEPPASITRSDPMDEALSMRLLRHHTKNALQRIIAQVSAAELRCTPAGTALAEDVERRIRLSARVSDALFGLTETPGPLAARLTSLCQSVVSLMADDGQDIRTTVHTGSCAERHAPAVLQVAHEFVTNAVKHGLHMRLSGQIDVTLHPGSGPVRGSVLTVRDDGWGPERPGFGEGLSTLQCIAAHHGGRVELAREPGWTVARLRLPGPA